MYDDYLQDYSLVLDEVVQQLPVESDVMVVGYLSQPFLLHVYDHHQYFLELNIDFN